MSGLLIFGDSTIRQEQWWDNWSTRKMVWASFLWLFLKWNNFWEDNHKTWEMPCVTTKWKKKFSKHNFCFSKVIIFWMEKSKRETRCDCTIPHNILELNMQYVILVIEYNRKNAPRSLRWKLILHPKTGKWKRDKHSFIGTFQSW